MRILVTGATGFIGRNLIPKLKKEGHDVIGISSKDYNLTEQNEVRKLFRDVTPDAIYHLAGKVGGILANKTSPAEFSYQNLAINTYFFEEAKKVGIKRLIYTLCGCSYGKNSPNPIKEEYLLGIGGLPDENAMFYSISKAAGHFQLVSYRRQYNLDWVSVIPGNVYGPWDNFSETGSHVIPGLIRRMHKAKIKDEKVFVAWGSGSPIRDFIYVEDVADALVITLNKHHEEMPINISSGSGISIRELVYMIKEVVGFEGEIIWDNSKPDGQHRKVFDITRMKVVLGFSPRVSLKDGLEETYMWFKKYFSKYNK